MAGLLASFLRAHGVLVLGAAGAALFYLDMLDEAVAFVQSYGWFLLLGAGVVLYADYHLGQLLVRCDVARSLQAANDPNRVDILRIEARKARERQQLELEAQSKAHKEAAAVKKKEVRKAASSPRRPERDDYNPLTGATSTARYKPSGFARPRGG